jgi:hypothetical protein
MPGIAPLARAGRHALLWGIAALGVAAPLVTACAGHPEGAPTAASAALDTGVRVAGLLTRKGSEPGSWWAITDDAGKVWKIDHPPPALEQALQRRQNQRIAVDAAPRGMYLGFTQIAIVRLREP